MGLIVKQQELISTSFDGVNEYISVPDNATLDFERTNAFSFSIWVYMNALGSTMSFISKRNTTTGNPGYVFYINSSNYVNLLLTSPTQVSGIITNTTLSINTLYHIVATKPISSDANNFNIYINGVLQAKSVTFNTLTSTSILNNQPLYIGRDTLGLYQNGRLDKAIIYNKELTAGEVTTIYNYGRKAGDVGISGVVSQWEMGEGATFNGTNWTFPDVVGSNNGTSVGMDITNVVQEEGYTKGSNGLVVKSDSYSVGSNGLIIQ